MHPDIGEEFLASVLEARPEDIDHIVDNQESVVTSLSGTYMNRWVLLVMALEVELLLL